MSAPLPDDGTGTRVLAALDEALPATRDADIARWCRHVDVSLVAHWRSGARGMPAWAVLCVLRRLPAGARLAVAGELLAPAGLTVGLSEEAIPGGRGLTVALDLSRRVAELAQMVDVAEQDGVWTEDEASAVHALLRSVDGQVAQLRARAHPGRIS